MSDQEYEVEKIVDYRVRKGKEEYQVKWKGCDEEECTWEPIENLTACMDMVREFKTQQGMDSEEEDEVIVTKRKNRKSKGNDGDESAQFETLPQRPKPKIQPKKKKITLRAEEKKAELRPNKKQEKKSTLIDEQVQDQNWFEPQQEPRINGKHEKSITKDEFKIEKMLTDTQRNVYFQVVIKGRRQLIPRKKVIETNVTALISFYEQYVTLKPKQPKS